MPNSFSKNNRLKDMVLLVVLFAVLLLFAFKTYLSQETATDPISKVGVNSFYQKLPKAYGALLNQQPLDSVLGANEEIRERKKALKFNAYILQNNLQRELILMRAKKREDTLKPVAVKFNIYPVFQEFTKSNFATVQSNVITYYHNGKNYEVVRQVLPNIAISKIVCYTKSWQTLIDKVDNKMISPKDAPHILIAKQNQKDSLSIGLNSFSSGYGFLFRKELQRAEIPFLPFEMGLTKEDVSKPSEDFTSYLKKHQLQLLYIPDDLVFWKKLTQEKELPELDYLSGDHTAVEENFKKYFSQNIDFATVFNIDKLTNYYALLNLYSNRVENGLYLNRNTETGLLEPFFIEKNLGKRNTYVKSLKIKDLAFLGKYSLALQEIASLKKTNSLIEVHSDSLQKILEVQHHMLPTNLFDVQLFEHNKLIIEKVLNPSTVTKIYLTKYDKKQIEVEVENLSNFPLQISELSYQKEKFIIGPRKGTELIMPFEKRKISFDLPDSFDNLFVHKKKKSTGFLFEKDIFDLYIGYHLAGTFDTKYNVITPFEELDELTEKDDLFRKEGELSKFNFLRLDEEKREIRFIKDSIILNQPLVFPEGYVIKASSGLQIDILAGGKLISKSPLEFFGSPERPIKIFSSDSRGQGIFVVSAKETSVLEHVAFDNLTNQEHGLWDLTGAVVFYESPVRLNYVSFINNSCEDGLNIVRTSFTMNNCNFRNTQSDAFDGDFVQGTLANCTFENLGNDAVDVSGSKLEIYNLKVINAGDKALSAGEDSQMKIEKAIISDSEIAVAGKDLSIVQIQDATITNSKLGFTAFQKKPEFGASRINATEIKMIQVETPHLIENRSSLILNGKSVETIDAVKEQMYGVEFGVDSKETRVKKTQ